MTDSTTREDGFIIIGSGPSAVAACSALLERGIGVTMVDAGLRPDTKSQALQMRIGATGQDEWKVSDVAEWRYKPQAKSTIGLKSWFGSLYPYDIPDFVKINGSDTGFRASFAHGGFSNVWGATILPYSERELRGFPLVTADLEKHWSAVLKLLPFSATKDSLMDRYPLYSEIGLPLDLSITTLSLLSRLSRRQAALKRRGIEFGQARLAVRASPDRKSSEGCVYCGRCLDGCPYDFIWSSVSTIRSFADRPNFRHLEGFVVESIREFSDGVHVVGRDLGGQLRRVTGTRALIAAGTVGSARILLKSGLVGDTLTLRDSQTVFAPFVWAGPRQHPPQRTVTLAEVFMSLDDRSVSDHSVQIQVYPSNDGLVERAQSEIPTLAAMFKKMGRMFDQVLPVVIYLHSEDSNSAVIRERGDVLLIEELQNPRREKVLSALWKRLLPPLARVGFFGFPPLAAVATVGEGFHTGASLPMSANPGPGVSDLLGRPFGCQRIHVVDASILSQIPAGPITFSVMANAHRIASQLGDMER